MEYTNKDFSDSVFQNSLNYHAALSQYFRWFQIYERPFTEAGLQHQAGILTDDVIVESISNTANGINDYKEKISALNGSTNAHHLNNVKIKLLDETTLQLNAKILYQGIRNNQVINSHVDYQAWLSLRTNDLPLFKHLKLSHGGEAKAQPYKDAYPYNRSAAIMHYWLSHIEKSTKDASPFKEVLADDFQLNLSKSNLINNMDQFASWIQNINQNIKASAHFAKDLTAVENNDGTITMTVHFDWRGINSDNKPMIGATEHTWLLENDTNLRFPRIKNMNIRQVTPFQVLDLKL